MGVKAVAPRFVIGEMPQQVAPDLIEKLLQTDTGTIGHVLDSGFMDPGISARTPGRKIAGTAVTVRVTVPDSVMGHYVLKFIRPGDVLVIDRGQDQFTANWGGGTAAAGVARGLTGLIIDGAGNDISQSAEHGLSIWCRHVSSVTTKYRGISGEMNVPINCGGVAVSPGDAILADENGVVVIPQRDLADVVETALGFNRFEEEFIARLLAEPGLCYPDETGASALVEGIARRPD